MLKFKSGFMAAACCVAVSLVAAPLGAQQVGTGAFPDTSVIEKQLKRGASGKAEVQRLLGIPNGTGRSDWLRPPGTALPPTGEGRREIWFYDDIVITDMKSGNGPATMNVRQQILLVFFKGDIFDGYLWTSNALTPTASQ